MTEHVAPQDAMMTTLLDLLLRSPSCPTQAITMVTELQRAVWDLDQHLVAGGSLPSRWTNGIRRD